MASSLLAIPVGDSCVVLRPFLWLRAAHSIPEIFRGAGRNSFNAMALSLSRLGRLAHPPTITHLMTAAREHPGLLSLAAGFTDTASLPGDPFLSLAQEVLATPAGLDALQYGTNQGRTDLRQALVRRVAEQEGAQWARPWHESDLLITNGSQQALYLAMQVLADPGDIILVDQPTYFVYLEMLSGLGLEAVGLPTQADGTLDLPAVATLLRQLDAEGKRSRVKALYLVSYHSNPSGRTLTEDEKTGLARTLSAGEWFLPVLEDAAYRELAFSGDFGPRSVFALREWDSFPKVYFGTLTKPFATGLKVGYAVVSDPDLRSRMLHVKGNHDFGSAHFNQAILARALESGVFEAQVQKVRALYQRKGSALDAALRGTAGELPGWRWRRPAGGLYLWLEGPAELDTGLGGAFCEACLQQGVLYVPGALCFPAPAPRNYVRLSYGVLDGAPLGEAARRFAGVAHRGIG